MKKILLSLLALLCMSTAMAGDKVYKTLTFPDGNSATATDGKEINSYSQTWTATMDGLTWTLQYFNTFKNTWAYVKCGNKNNPYKANITTPQMDVKVTKFVVTVDAVNASLVNSTYLEVASDANFTADVQKKEVTIAKGEVIYEVPTPKENQFYRLTIDCAASGQNGSNGFVQISKVVMYSYDSSIVSDPYFTPAEGILYEPTAVAINGGGADVYYSFDNASFSKYTEPLMINETATIYAYAQSGDVKSNTVSATYTVAKAYSGFDELLQETPTETGWPVIVPFQDEEIAGFYGGDTYRNGVFLTRMANGKTFELYCRDAPMTWNVGDKLSGVAKGIYQDYKGQWEISLVNWNGINTAVVGPAAPEIAFDANTMTVTITDPSGNNNTIYYTTDGTEPEVAETGSIKVYVGPFTISGTTTVKAICADDNDTPSAVTTKVCSVSTTLNTLAEVKDVASRYTAATEEVTLNLNDVLVTGVNGSNVFVSDKTAAFLFYASGLGLKKGDKIAGTVKGKPYYYNGLPEMTITDKSGITVASQDNEVTLIKMKPAEVTADHANMYVAFEDLKYVRNETVSNKVNYIFTDGTTEVTLRDQFNNLSNLNFNAGDAYSYTLRVFVIPYKETIQYYAVDANDITEYTTKEKATCRFDDFKDNQVFNMKAQTSVTYSFSIASDAPEILYNSTNDKVATIGYGVINFQGPGIATVTISVPETEMYTSASDSRTVKVWSGAEGTEQDPLCPGDVYSWYLENDTLTDVWVKGYIVGAANSNMNGAQFSDTTNVGTNIILAPDADNTNVADCIPVELPKGAVRDALNLKDNKGNYKKEVLLHGNIIKYMSQAGLKGVDEFKFTAAGMKGDANGDGVIDVADITTIAAYILDNTKVPASLDNADANSDGKIDVADITTVAGIILKN